MNDIMDFSPQDLGYIREDSDEGWRSVRGAAGFVERDVSDDKRITLLQECFAAYVGNPIAKRYIDLHLAFIRHHFAFIRHFKFLSLYFVVDQNNGNIVQYC